MGKNVHAQVQNDEKHFKPLPDDDILNPSVKKCVAAWSKRVVGHWQAILFLVAAWALLSFYEPALLFRVNELSVFLDNDIFYKEMMSAPAGLLSYVGCYLVQYFYYPALGATIYVLLLALVYRLTCLVFDLSAKRGVLALLPVAALLATNTELGYWIFYLKLPGYYYVAVLAVIASLLVAWVVKKSSPLLKLLLLAAWIYWGYPFVGTYALVSAGVIAIHALALAIGNRQGKVYVLFSSIMIVLAVAMGYFVPRIYYNRYISMPIEEVYCQGVPFKQWKIKNTIKDEDRLAVLSLAAETNGCVGYPSEKELRKFRLTVETSYTEKALNTAKSDLYSFKNINQPVGGKSYTFTFVASDGKEYYLDNSAALSVKEKTGAVPASGRFVCLANKTNKNLFSFKAPDGKYLSLDGNRLVTSDIPHRFIFVKMGEGSGVQATDEALFGVVNMCVETKDKSPVCVAFNGKELVLNGAPSLNSSSTSAVRIAEVGFNPKPFSLELPEKPFWINVGVMWVPFIVLLLAYVLVAIVGAIPLAPPTFWEAWEGRFKALPFVASLLLLLLIAAFSWRYWYNDVNFRIENKQNRAMWEEDWDSVAEYARGTDVPTRQVVMNKNIALLKTGRSGNEMFEYPEGSADIISSNPVRLAQTGGKMSYYQYGKFNFCYRWCVEDAVEYGWRVEYLKHAVRSMLLAGEYRIAQRYIDILKLTKFYAGWAEEMEQFVQNPELIKKEQAFAMPLLMCCYEDALEVDESYVEAYLTKNLTMTLEKMPRVYVETALSAALTRKDSRTFWYFLNYYVNELKVNSLPKHYQEAVLLFLNLDKNSVQVPQAFIDRFISPGVDRSMQAFLRRVSQNKGKSEAEMAPAFIDDFKDTYFYFYFFVRNIKTN